MGIPNQPGSTQSFQIACPHCTGPNAPGVQFCNWCGQPLPDTRAIVQGTPPPQPYQQPYPPQYPQQQQQPYPPQYQQPPANYQYPPTQPLTPPQYQQSPYQQSPYQQAPQYMQPQFSINQTMAVPPSQVVVMNRPTKSVLAAFLLTFFFGPLGMFYSTVGGAIIMLLVAVGSNVAYYLYIQPRLYLDSLDSFSDSGLASVSIWGCGLTVGIWLVSIIWGTAAAASYNNKSQATIVR